MLKKRLILGLCLCLTICDICLSGSYSDNVQAVRTGFASSTKEIEFDIIEEFKDQNIYKTVAKKTISSQSLKGYETVSLCYDEYLITFDVTTDIDTSSMTLNVYFDNSNEIIIENFTGYPMTNYNDEQDIIFIIDDQYVFLSDLNQFSGQEACSWFGNALHKVLNAGMVALAYIEPAINILIYTSANVIGLLYKTVKNTSYISNYCINSKKTQPKGFIYGQHFYADWKFGFSNLSHSGCGAIAGYNLSKAKGCDFTLADTVFLYESLGIEIGAAQGFLGSNPYQISYFLMAVGISFKKVFDYKSFETLMKDSQDYYLIMASWNGEDTKDGAHIFMIDKDCNSNFKYTAYNYYSLSDSRTTQTNDYLAFVRGKISNTFMCAYFVEK